MVSCVRNVYQCLSCTYKYKDKQEKCNNCNYNEFIEKEVYCLDKINSYNAFMNVIVGRRRGGKSYCVAELCVNNWLEKKQKFVWIRRYKTEMKKALEAFNKLGYSFDNIGVYYLDEEVQTSLVNGKEKSKVKKVKKYIGLIITLSTASRIRGGEFNDFTTMIIDEYGDEDGSCRKTEFTLINSLIVSVIDEKKFAKVYVLSNNINRFLPLFTHIGVQWDKEWTYNWKLDAVVHVWNHQENKWVGASKNWLKSTEYHDYAVYNKPMDYDKQLIEQYKLEFSKPEVCFRLGGQIKNNLKVVKIDNINYAIDDCYNCTHDWKAIDDYNSIAFVKKVNKEIQIFLIKLYVQQKLKYTSPLLKTELRNWVASHLFLLEN